MSETPWPFPVLDKPKHRHKWWPWNSAKGERVLVCDICHKAKPIETTVSSMIDEQLTFVASRLAPLVDTTRGWVITSLQYAETEDGGVWSCDIVGPRDLIVEDRLMVGHPRMVQWFISSSSFGTIWSTTPQGLVDEVESILKALGANPKEVTP